MVFDLSFEEAMDVLQNRLGWVQGENFDKHEYLALDRTRHVIIKNVVDDNRTIICDYCGDQTEEVWFDEDYLPEEMKTQKYRFILVLNPDSIMGVGGFSEGDDRNSYLRYKAINRNRKPRCDI